MISCSHWGMHALAPVNACANNAAYAYDAQYLHGPIYQHLNFGPYLS